MKMPPLESDHLESVQGFDGRIRPRVVYKSCALCWRPVTLRYRPTATLRPIDNLWPCPYQDCSKESVNRIALPGALLAWWQGHTPRPVGVAP